jgi:hypothetical protein
MAYSKVTSSIAALIEETQLSTIDKMIAFLGEKIELDDDMQKMFEEFKDSIKGSAKAELKKSSKKSKKSSDESGDVKKRTRAPSAYNLYIKEKMAEFKAAGHKGNLMKMAIDAWNEDKSSGKIEVKSTTKNTNTTDIESDDTSDDTSDDGTSDDDTKTKKTKATKAKETKTKETKTKEKKTKKTIDPTSEPTIDTTSDTDYE